MCPGHLGGAALLDTARVWLAADGATSVAATRMYLHRNTVRYRLRQLEQRTGLSRTKPLDLATVHIALECARMLDLV